MNTPTAIEAALREAITRHLTSITHAFDYPAIPDWMREFDRLDEFEAAHPQSPQINSEKQL